MRISGRGINLATLLFVGLFCAASPAPSFAVQDHSDHRASGEPAGARPISQATATPPATTGKGTKDGIQIGARSNDGNRLDRSSKPSKGAKRGAKKSPASSERARDKRNLVGPVKHDDFRLDIGICGHPGGNSPGLTRCLPAIEDDGPEQPEQPNQPEATPSMVVAVRIPQPQDVTWDQVLSEVKDVAFPRLSVKVQPVGRTLVNLDTIVYTDQSKVSTTTVTLLGFPVVVEATPLSYTWNFGDGTSVTTTTPGRPHPAKDITHKYMKKGGVSLTLTTNYGARFNVAGTGWQYVDGTVPITGPVTGLQVREAVPVLVEPGR